MKSRPLREAACRVWYNSRMALMPAPISFAHEIISSISYGVINRKIVTSSSASIGEAKSIIHCRKKSAATRGDNHINKTLAFAVGPAAYRRRRAALPAWKRPSDTCTSPSVEKAGALLSKSNPAREISASYCSIVKSMPLEGMRPSF